MKKIFNIPQGFQLYVNAEDKDSSNKTEEYPLSGYQFTKHAYILAQKVGKHVYVTDNRDEVGGRGKYTYSGKLNEATPLDRFTFMYFGALRRDGLSIRYLLENRVTVSKDFYKEFKALASAVRANVKEFRGNEKPYICLNADGTIRSTSTKGEVHLTLPLINLLKTAVLEDNKSTSAEIEKLINSKQVNTKADGERNATQQMVPGTISESEKRILGEGIRVNRSSKYC